MTRNVGWFDRLIRLILGIGLLGLYGALDSPWRYATLIGLVFIATALTSACPVYGLLGWSTRRRQRVPEAPPGAGESLAAKESEQSGHSDAWHAGHEPEEDERTWPPKKPPEWRPPGPK